MEVFFLSLVFIFSILFVYVVRKEHLFSLISFFFIFITLLYIIIPSIDILFFEKQVNELYPLVVFISFFSISCGVYFGGCSRTFKSTVLIKLEDKKERLLLLFLLVFALISLFIYIQSFGGIMSAMINGVKLRYAGETQSLGSWGFLLYFVALAKIVACVSFYRLLSGTRFNKLHWLFFILSFAAVLLYALVNGSRGAIVMTTLLFIYSYFYFHVKKPESNVTRKVVILSVVLIPFILIFIVYGKVLISNTAKYIETGKFEFSFEKYEGKRSVAGARFVSEFSHPYESIDYLLSNDFELNYFKHFLTAPLNVIPSRLFGTTKPPRITEVNTKNITGSTEGGRPPGIIASFWFGGGIYVITCVLFVYGFLLSLFQKHAEKLIKINPLLTPYFIFIFFAIPWQSTNGDPSIILKSNIYLLVFILIFYCFMLMPTKFNWRGRRLSFLKSGFN
jgi:oligosaccharide repeat unit polymerase